MDIINEYKNRFYNLLESTMGDVRPLITENTVSGSPEFNQIVNNLGLDLEETTHYDRYNIKNGNQLFGGNGSNYTWKDDGNKGVITIYNIDSKLPNNDLNNNGELSVNNIDVTTKIETIKTIVQNVINGNIDKNLLFKGDDGNFPKFFEFHQNNTLEGYDALPFHSLDFDLKGNQILDIWTVLIFKSKNPENKVKLIRYYADYLDVKYTSEDTDSGFFRKEYVLDGNKISFEKDRKSTKGVGRYKSDSLNDLADTDKYVKYGMKGDIVKQIQRRLLNSGQLTNTYQLAKDNEACKQDYKQCHGTFGPKTYAAVKEFQAANDLVEDGIVGPDTAEALRNF